MTFASIADDDARHSALSWSLASWIANRLDFAANRRVRNRAVVALRAAISRPSAEDFSPLGLPSCAMSRVKQVVRNFANSQNGHDDAPFDFRNTLFHNYTRVLMVALVLQLRMSPPTKSRAVLPTNRE